MSHETTVKVRFAELDPYQHVNHAVYLTYFETARVEALDHVDLGITKMLTQGHQFVVVELTVRYRRPAMADDSLVIRTRVTEIGRVSTSWSQHIHRDGVLLTEASLRVAVTDRGGRPRRLPPEIAERLEGLR
jgi:acyl-CoA thioester hydrolase